MKLFIKNVVPWYKYGTRWEIRDTNGIVGEYLNYPLPNRPGTHALNGVLRLGNSIPIDIKPDYSVISLKTLFFSSKNNIQPPMNYPYKFYENNQFIGGEAQVSEKVPGRRLRGYQLVRCYYRNDIYEAFQVPVSSDDIQIYIYKNNQTVAVFQSVPLVLDGQVEYYLYTEDETELSPLFLVLMCYDIHYYKEVVNGLTYKVYPNKYEKRDYTNTSTLIMKMDPQFLNPLLERHKDDIFM